MRKSSSVILGIVTLYLILPVIATFMFSISVKWNDSILPDGYTLAWYGQLLKDPGFWAAMGRSILVSLLAVCLSLVVIVPATYVVNLYYPKWQKLFQVCALMSYALPGVILAVGLINVYASSWLPISGTVWILLGAYFVLCLPFIYNAVANNLVSLEARTLVEAAESLGATPFQAFRLVILPNIKYGLVNSALLCFSVTFGEFVLANLLVGGQFQTLQLKLYKTMWEDGRVSSAMVIIYFILIALITAVMVRMVRQKEGRFDKKAKADKRTGVEERHELSPTAESI